MWNVECGMVVARCTTMYNVECGMLIVWSQYSAVLFSL